MNKYLINLLVLISLIFFTNVYSKENIMILKLKTGDVKIELFEDVAPKHVERIKKLANDGSYDNVVFHRVIDGFMAQTGDVRFGNSSSDNFDLNRAGMGGSDLPDLKLSLVICHMKEEHYLWQGHLIQIVQIVNFLFVLSPHLF